MNIDATEIYGISVSVDERNTRTMNVVFENHQDAATAAKGAGWYGSDGVVIPMLLYKSVEAYQKQVEADKLAAAKSRLSDEEFELLRRYFTSKPGTSQPLSDEEFETLRRRKT